MPLKPYPETVLDERGIEKEADIQDGTDDPEKEDPQGRSSRNLASSPLEGSAARSTMPQTTSTKREPES
jgi:hypothetical protein